ncbi:hypothetical protein F4677DRAFT_465868 [Hypoxylon crocopeplum]|nr:hypothetical protein F4677DRAFT_465868 [Hypoxylon crocopeplum]
MCGITRSRCRKCRQHFQGLQLCDRLVNKVNSSPSLLQTAQSARIFCPDFIWPPVYPVRVVTRLCNNCSEIPRYGEDPESDTPWGDQWRTPEFTLEEALVSELCHCHLTLRIPLCSLCKSPTFFVKKDTTYATQDNYKFGIEGIEMDINSVLWKWMVRAGRVLQDPVTTRIVTGFVNKPCSTCINLEMALRCKVSKYLVTCDPVEAWAVWDWLIRRCSGLANFWQHESHNAGLPNLPVPSGTNFRALMANGWKARTGVPWEAIHDLGMESSSLPFAPHPDGIFRYLAQWNQLAGVVGKPVPIIQCPPQPLGYENLEIDYEHRDHHGQDCSEDDNHGVNGHTNTRGAPNTPDSDSDSSDSDSSHYDDRPRKRARFNENPVSGTAYLDSNAPPNGIHKANSVAQPSSNGYHNGTVANGQVGSSSATTLNDGVSPSQDSADIEWDSLAQDPNDLFGDDLFGDDEFAVKHPGGAAASSAESSNGDHHNLEIVESSPPVVPQGTVSADFVLSEFGFWHLNGYTDPRLYWHLPIGVTPNEPEAIEGCEKATEGHEESIDGDDTETYEESTEGSTIDDDEKEAGEKPYFYVLGDVSYTKTDNLI